jgi:hypothetical protein
MNNNNNDNSLNNNTYKYSDKSTQTSIECNECETTQQQEPSLSKDELITTETQTDFTNLHSESICCLSRIPYADMTYSPPPLPSRLTNESVIIENNKEHILEDDNNEESTQVSRGAVQFTIDSSIGMTTQTAIAAVTNNGDVQYNCSETAVNGESS